MIDMADFTITWTTGDNPSTIEQLVQYKKSTDTSYTTFSIVGPDVTTVNVAGLEDNTIYDFRIQSNCNYGGPSLSNTSAFINFSCPVITVTSTSTTVSYSFVHPLKSINGFTVQLYESNGTTLVSTQTPTISSTLTGTFTGLTAATLYKIKLTLTASSFSEACTLVSAATDGFVCSDPTSVVATIETILS